MIYIVRKSKRSARKNEMKLELNEAKQFLYSIDARNFRINDYFVYNGDSLEEIKELVEYFAENYLIETQQDVITVYYVNPEINKYSRMRSKGVTVNSIANFKEKIEKIIPYSTVEIELELETFEVKIETAVGVIKLVCNYNLEIIQALASNHEGKFVDIGSNDMMVKEVNNLFRKQRYYYKNRKNG